MDPEAIWEANLGNVPVFEAYEKQQQEDMAVIDAFVKPTRISIRGPVTSNNKQQQESNMKRVPFEKHYMTIYNDYINCKFSHLHCRGAEEEFDSNSQQTQSSQESDDEDSQHEGRLRTRKRVRKKFDISQPYECFLCGWGNVQHDSIEAPHITEMVNMITINRGVHHDWDIAIQVSTYFMEDVYDPETGMEELTPEIVFDHLIGNHSLDASSYIAQRIKKRKEYLFVMEQNLILEDGSLDHKMMDQINKNESIIMELYAKKPATLMFSNGNNAEDMKRQANCISLLPKMEKVSTRRTKRRVIL